MSPTEFGIVPLGPIYFGDGRPFCAGDSDWGGGRFPPTPRTLQGLIRTTLLRSALGEALSSTSAQRVTSLVGPPEHLPEGWQVFGPWPASWCEKEDSDGNLQLEDVSPWVPLPFYVYKLKGDNSRFCTVRILEPKREDEFSSFLWDANEDAEVPITTQKVSEDNQYIHPSALCKLLAGLLNFEPDHVAAGYPFVKEEQRVGIAIEETQGIAAEGMLYTRVFHRLAPESGLYACFEGNTATEIDVAALGRGCALLGGASRLARLHHVGKNHSDWEIACSGSHLPKEPADNTRFWLWITTPARVEDPCHPAIRYTTFGKAELRIVTATIGRPMAVGGFSFANKQSNPSRRYVPPGSAWLIEISGGSSADRSQLLRSLHNKHTIGDSVERAFGFGHTFVACLPKTRE